MRSHPPHLCCCTISLALDCVKKKAEARKPWCFILTAGDFFLPRARRVHARHLKIMQRGVQGERSPSCGAKFTYFLLAPPPPRCSHHMARRLWNFLSALWKTPTHLRCTMRNFQNAPLAVTSFLKLDSETWGEKFTHAFEQQAKLFPNKLTAHVNLS